MPLKSYYSNSIPIWLKSEQSQEDQTPHSWNMWMLQAQVLLKMLYIITSLMANIKLKSLLLSSNSTLHIIPVPSFRGTTHS
ncbi:hypothetical protein PSTT_10487 [Puccinia striiformis]|uniref:Uncharacterized protein n=1 Tax=Puccinia striiformis TaxID=27350 RepID=A0A2S4V488_9BASI|nr:hypothetical protein PSTT_10487 [Puccinia striiformis]